MAIVLLLREGDDPEVLITSLASARLAALGVTSVSLVRDRGSVGVVLEGWAFDASSASAAAVELFGPGRPPFRTLREFMHAAVIPPDSDAPSTEEGAP